MIGVTKLIACLGAFALISACCEAATWSAPLRHQRVVTDHPHHRALRTSLSPFPWGLRVPSIDPATGKTASVWTRLFSPPHYEAVIHTDLKVVGHGWYVMEVAVGTPPQRIPLGLDLNSADVAILNHNVGGHAFYDHTKSSTYIANGTQVKYAEGTSFEVDGFMSRDQFVVVGAGSHLTLEQFPFVELCAHLGLTLLGAFDDHRRVTFGGIDENYKDDDITYFPSGHGGWEAPVSGVRVAGKSIVESSARAMLFDGMDFIVGPTDQIEAIMDAVGADNYTLPCAGAGPDITIYLGTLAITLTKADYAIPLRDGICAFAMRPTLSSEPFWMFGTALLRHTYVALDYGVSADQARLGLAPLKKSN